MAGIYIPNMNIPEEEPDGTMSGTLLLIMSNGKAQIIRTKEIVDVINVPDHGRLIDASELDADLEHQDMRTGEYDAIGFSILEIDNAPTVIPADREANFDQN